MPAIGPPLHLWTSLLLVCGMPTCAFAQAANETPTTTAATATLTTTSPGPASSSTTTSGLALSPTSTPTRRYSEAASTCPFRTINYITHTLPQQCAKTSWSAPDGTASTAVPVANSTNSIQDALSRTSVSTSDEEAVGDPNPKAENARPDSLSSESASAFAAVNIETAVRGEDPEGELEIESPFDNANFLSFEEWKKRNLAQAGQSPDNIGQGRAAPTNQAGRRRPVNVNALDSLGDEGEIEIDFSGFGPPSEGGHLPSHTQADTQDRAASKPVDEDGKIAPSSWALSKDAGKTCKERFNYASFDCAATVLKANKQAKSSTSVLVENKDSYMLNECSASNKFLIVELCDDILVDTVVLANYEFFSSMFRHFRVSVSDRYPVKMERWRTLGTFEARNTRDIQPFLITEPQIWARYVRVEFLTQYGNEFYCPLSLLRVHGTTMMEQFRREEEEARGLDDEDGDLEAEGRDVVKPASDSGPLSPDQIPLRLISSEPNEPDSPSSGPAPKTTGQDLKDTKDETRDQKAGAALDIPNQYTTKTSRSSLPTHSMDHTNFVEHSGEISSTLSIDFAPSELNQSASDIVERVTQATIGKHVQATAQEHTASDSSSSVAQTEAHFDGTSKPPVASPSTTHVAGKAHTHHTAGSSPTQSTRASSPQPVPPVPSTQESFYKSIHKRLLYLEANSTLSLQYIEEQSRILRDAFMKVEKRQLAKTEKFLSHLNSTVMQELKSFQNMYDQLWQSTIIELESMKERQNIEIGEIGARISLMADELVWQKRMAVVQSTLLLLCLGLVLFVRSGTLSSPSDAAIVQQLGNKYNSFFESSPPRSLESPGLVRRRRTFRNMWRSDTSIGLSDPPSDGQLITSDAEMEASRVENEIELTPPTPDTPLIHPATPTADDQAARVQVLETQSGPATPNGTRDSRPSWEEVDRAMDQLKAEEQSVHSPTSRKRSNERKSKRSPLRRAHSSYDGTVDDVSSDMEEGDGHAP